MDFRYALRMLARTPGFTLMALLTLALGIGINTVVFTLYNAVALKPLAVSAPAELVRLQWRTDGFPSDKFSWTEYQRVAAQNQSFTDVVATSTPQTVLCQIPELGVGAEIAQIRLVSGNYFAALGVTPTIGRAFAADDRAAVIVSHEFWTRKLHAEPSVYGMNLTVHGSVLPIFGVAPKTFAGTGAPAQTPDMWIPASAQTTVLPGRDWIHDSSLREWQILARRKSGVSAAQASAELAVLSGNWPGEDGKPVHLSGLKATFFQTDSGEFQGYAAICLTLLVAVALILLMACVNLVNLIAARHAGRRHEIGVRMALGATRFRLMRQLCTESLVLGVLGGAMGLLLSVWTCAWLGNRAMEIARDISNGALRVSLDLQPDWHVLLWSLAVSIATGLAVGLLPALRASHADVIATLKQGTAAAGFHGLEARRMRNVLMAAQIASCLVLLTAAGLLFRGVTRSSNTNPGFEVRHLAMVGMNAGAIAGSAATRAAAVGQAIKRIEAVPETQSVAWADRVPFLGHGSGDFTNEAGAGMNCLFNGVSEHYLDTLGVPLLAGRTFTRAEVDSEAPLAVVSEATATRLWPGKSALGRRMGTEARWVRQQEGHPEFTVIGVAKTVRSTYLSKEDSGFVYIPRALHDNTALLLIRTRTEPEKAFNSFAVALAAVDSNLPSRSFMISMQQGPMRLQTLMAQAPAVAASVLGSLALLLACAGIFGVVSRMVAMRTREIGLRLVLGATKGDVIWLIAGQTFQPVAWGTAAGLLGALGVSALLHSQVVTPDSPDLTYGAGAFDPATFLAVLAVLAGVVFFAAVAPVRRATLVEPAVALRDE